jgi:Acyltransferase
MNIQPYGVPEQHWAPQLSSWWFHLARPMRRKSLRQQRIDRIDVEGIEHLEQALKNKFGVLLTPNHSFHWDSYCLLEAAERLAKPFYIMTAWQVFAQSSWFERLSMQRCGCFSVDREGTDLQALKTAVDIMQNRPHPLVIFPEGDVYHTNDRVTPFRDGAAAMALMAARKAERPIVIIPVAIKRWYIEDPTPSMLDTASQLESRLYWRPLHHMQLVDRILRIADGLLSLKELEYFNCTANGSLPDRIQRLASSVLSDCEQRYGISQTANMIPERIKEVRRRIIQASQTQGEGEQKRSLADEEQIRQWAADMHDMFFVTQLYSYPGDYLQQHPSWERLAETLDKLEEDALNASYPSVRGPRRALVRFDEPIELPRDRDRRLSAADLTDRVERRVQSMLDEINAEHSR